MRVHITVYKWHEFFPRGIQMSEDLYIYTYILIYVEEWVYLCCHFSFPSQEQYWCCDCALGSYCSCMFHLYHFEGFFLLSTTPDLVPKVTHVFVYRSISWILRFGMPFSPQYLAVYMVHFAVLERSVDLPTLPDANQKLILYYFDVICSFIFYGA